MDEVKSLQKGLNDIFLSRAIDLHSISVVTAAKSSMEMLNQLQEDTAEEELREEMEEVSMSEAASTGDYDANHVNFR